MHMPLPIELERLILWACVLLRVICGKLEVINHSFSYPSLILKKFDAPEHIMNTVLKHAQAVVAPYQDPAKGAPDPSFVLQLPDETYTSSNLYAVQKFFDGEFQFDVFFESASAKQKLSCKYCNCADILIKINPAENLHVASLLDNGVPAFQEKFTRRFNEKFPVPEGSSESLVAFSKAVTSNLLGGVGYFYGDSLVDPGATHEWDEDESSEVEEKPGPHLTEPKALLTATPSRSFFPRGFYWLVNISHRICMT